MKDPEFKTIRRAVEKNCGGFDTASDAHIRSKWASLDDETRAAYLASVSAKREKPTDGDGATAPGGDA